MNLQLNEQILNAILPVLKPYLDQFYDVDRIILNPEEVEIIGKEKEDSIGKTMLLRLYINHDHQQVGISNIFMPEFMRNKILVKKS